MRYSVVALPCFHAFSSAAYFLRCAVGPRLASPLSVAGIIRLNARFSAAVELRRRIGAGSVDFAFRLSEHCHLLAHRRSYLCIYPSVHLPFTPFSATCSRVAEMDCLLDLTRGEISRIQDVVATDAVEHCSCLFPRPLL